MGKTKKEKRHLSNALRSSSLLFANRLKIRIVHGRIFYTIARTAANCPALGQEYEGNTLASKQLTWRRNKPPYQRFKKTMSLLGRKPNKRLEMWQPRNRYNLSNPEQLIQTHKGYETCKIAENLGRNDFSKTPCWTYVRYLLSQLNRLYRPSLADLVKRNTLVLGIPERKIHVLCTRSLASGQRSKQPRTYVDTGSRHP